MVADAGMIPDMAMEIFSADGVTHRCLAAYEEIEPISGVTFAAVFLLLARLWMRKTGEAARVKQDITRGLRD